jgi:sugar O-acyltransferase (sialic acid O-acetyltransferase NeuD family)
MKAPLVMFGAGGHGKVVLEISFRAGMPIDFIVDDNPQCCELLGVKVLGAKDKRWRSLQNFFFIVAIGENSSRERIFRDLTRRGGRPKSLLHPFSAVAPSARVGDGVVICAGAVVNSAAIIGNNCIINTAASVDHDCTVGDHIHICPGVRLAGKVTIGARSMIGTGSIILPNLKIGAESIIGAGSLVNRDLPAGVVAFGNPAKVQRGLG